MLLIFDLDDTLIDTWNTHFPYKMSLVAKKIVELSIVENQENVFALLMKTNEKSENGKDAIIKCLTQWGVSENKIINKIIDVYYDPAQKMEIPLLDGARELLTWARQNHTLAIVTQGRESEQLNKFPSAQLDQNMFSKIIVTPYFNKGLCYEELSGEFSISPEEILVCGDKYKTDLLPAKELGMKTVHMKWGRGKLFVPQNGEVDFIIDHLSELKSIIEGLK